MSVLKLNPAIAKTLANGQIQCLICNSQVSQKAWLAHTNGRKHKEAVENKKKLLSAPPKRSASHTPEAPTPKKAREEPVSTATTSGDNGGLPSDFFDSSIKKSLDAQTPWQKARLEEKEKHTRIQAANIIEGVPVGFFDDKKKDSMVREAVDHRANMEKEFDKFLNELNEVQTEEMQKLEEEAEREARERDLRIIDEHMAELKRLNELEIRKEELLREKRNKKKLDDSDDDDLNDMDFNDWRSHQII